MTRGLETILPLPSASSAEISRFRKRLAAALNSDSAKVAGLKPFSAGRRQVDELGVGEGDAVGAGLQRLRADRVQVAADGDTCVAAADAVARDAAANAAQVDAAETHAERAAEGVVGVDDARLDQHLAHRDVDLGDQRLDFLQLATECR